MTLGDCFPQLGKTCSLMVKEVVDLALTLSALCTRLSQASMAPRLSLSSYGAF